MLDWDHDAMPRMGDTLWFMILTGIYEISVTSDEYLSPGANSTRRVLLRPYTLQHVALYTQRLENVDFYTEALGF